MVIRDPTGVMVSGAVCWPRCCVCEGNASNCGCNDGERTVGHVAVRVQFVVVFELELATERGRVVVGKDVDAVDHRDQHHYLKPQIGHNIGSQAPNSTQSAWAPSRTHHTARVGW